MHNRTILACVISAALAAGVMFLIGFRPYNVRALEIHNQSLHKENKLLQKQIDVLTEQTSVLEQMNAARQEQLDAINAALVKP